MAKKKATKQDCVGCRDDYYNYGNHSTTGECWLLKDAKLITRYAIGWWVPMDSIDNFTEVARPSCYRQPGHTAYLNEMPKHLRKGE